METDVKLTKLAKCAGCGAKVCTPDFYEIKNRS